jgi:uncharacterized protein YbjQ (UPF0145 family)
MALMELFVILILPLLLIGIGFTIGKVTEARHLSSLARREEAVGAILVTDVRAYLPAAAPSPQPQILVAEVVMSADYFKSMLAALKKIIGGELRTYEGLMFRARAEALVRLKEAAAQQGYNALCNLRLETASVGGIGHPGRSKAAMCAIIAWATAYRIS